jgi:hypothetical protein
MDRRGSGAERELWNPDGPSSSSTLRRGICSVTAVIAGITLDFSCLTGNLYVSDAAREAGE